MKQVEQFFKSHPNEDKVFSTSDGLLFRQDGDAALHAKSLEDKEVVTNKRPNADIADEPKTSGEAATQAAKANEAANDEALKAIETGKQAAKDAAAKVIGTNDEKEAEKPVK